VYEWIVVHGKSNWTMKNLKNHQRMGIAKDATRVNEFLISYARISQASQLQCRWWGAGGVDCIFSLTKFNRAVYAIRSREMLLPCQKWGLILPRGMRREVTGVGSLMLTRGVRRPCILVHGHV
jgi:hypothetical protein